MDRICGDYNNSNIKLLKKINVPYPCHASFAREEMGIPVVYIRQSMRIINTIIKINKMGEQIRMMW